MRSRTPLQTAAIASLLLALVAVLPNGGAFAAGPGPASTALESSRGAPPGRLSEQLVRTHGEVDQALARRARRLEGYRRAVGLREAAARKVETLKRAGTRGDTLESALRDALVLSEEAQVERSALLAAEADVARRGAQLLRLYDAVLAEQSRGVKRLRENDPQRARAVRTFRKLIEQKARVRAALAPVLVESGGAGATLEQVIARPDDDVQTLLEKADLARDLEERFLRRAEAVRRRIMELESERALARDTVGLMRTDALFDESDYRPVFVGGAPGSGPRGAGGLNPSLGAPSALSAGGAADASRQSTEVGSPPPENGNVNVSEPNDRAGQAPADVDPAPPTEADDDGAPGLDNNFSGSPDTGVGPTPVRNNLADGAVVPPAEQVFLGPGADADAQLRAMMASDELSLEELKALEKKLKAEARKMRRESTKIDGQVRGRVRR